MLSPVGKIIFIALILITALAFLIPVTSRYRIIRAGRPDDRFRHFVHRLGRALSKIFLQRCTLKNERILTGFMHVFIFYGALTFDIMTINHTLEGFIPHFYLFGSSGFGVFFSFLVDLFAILVLVGVAFFAIRRFISRPKAYATTPFDSGLIYIFLTLVTLSYLYFEFFAIAQHPETERLAFLGGHFAAKLAQSLSPAAIATHVQVGWWLHILLVYGFIAYVPHSKYFHMFAGSFNLLVSKDGSPGELPPMDIEKAEVFGIEKAMDFTWKDLLDGFACMECGRCQDVCPAFTSDKPLSPKMIIFNMKAHLLASRKPIQSGDRDSLKALMEGVFTEGEIWTCTTCGACMHVCPVEIEHISKIVGVRQSQVLMESRFPSELNSFFRNMETNSNPWGIGFAERQQWTEGLDVRTMQEHPQAEYLFWVGCAGSFDEEGKKITRALVTVLNRADVDFAILGTEEKCCGDSARRLGNEYLFQLQAAENIETFARYNVAKLITACPHGFHTFKNEYPRLVDFLPDLSPEARIVIERMEVIHHTHFIRQLLREGKLSINPTEGESVTYHDSCYLGRHNGLVQEPREILWQLGGDRLREIPNNGEHSFCCGAGGGLMWTEESLGRRINHIRTEEVISTGAKIAATSCPFCQTMLQDGLKDKDREDIRVRDIAQLVADAVADNNRGKGED